MIVPPKPAPPTHAELKVALQKHQIERLAVTYRDLIESPRWSRLAQFFFSDLYLVGDRTQRNDAFLRLYKHFERILDASFLAGLKSLVDFYLLSETLDEQVTKELLALGSNLAIDAAMYEKAYRWADNYDERVRQLEYVEDTLTFVHSMSHRRLIGVMISTMQATSRLIGAAPMVDFLDRGYTAFRDVPDITFFKETVQTRERERVDRIYRDIPGKPTALAKR